MNGPPAPTKAPTKNPKAKKQNAGPKSRLKPLLAALLVVLIAGVAFLFFTSGGDDEQTTKVAGKTTERPTTTSVTNSTEPTTPTSEVGPEPTSPTTVTPPPTPPSPGPALTPTQERALCHMAFVGLAEGKTDTGDPLDTCTSGDWMSVGLEVSIYLHGDPNQDRAGMLRAECDARRAAGVTPKACVGI